MIAIDWHPTGEKLLGVQPPNINIWNTTNGAFIETIGPDPMPLLSAVWSPDGTKLAMGDLTGSIFVTNLATGEIEFAEVFDRYAICSLAWSPDNTRLAARTASGMIQILYRGDFLTEDGILNTASQNAISLDWHPTKDWLASGDAEGKLMIWDVPGRQVVEEIDTGSALLTVRWSPDGNQLAYSGGMEVNIIDIPLENVPPIAHTGTDQIVIDNRRLCL